MSDSRRRSVIKALSYRFLASVTTTIIVFLLTQRLVLAIGVGLIDSLMKVLCYYLHERLWQYIPWGKSTHPLAATSLKKDMTSEDLEMIQQKLRDLGYI